MSDVRLSSATRALLEAAKTDGPSAAARAKMWAGISGAVGGAVAGGAAAAGATTGGAGNGGLASGSGGAAAKLAVGTLLGAPLTVGLAALVLHFGSVPAVRAPAAHRSASPSAPVASLNAPVAGRATTADANATNGTTARPTGASAARSVREATAITITTATVTRFASTATPPVAGPSAPRAREPAAPEAASSSDALLAREALIVAGARAALTRGDPRGALRAIASARALPSPQLVPEELAVEGQALRALGRHDEADEIELRLKLFYPESALGR